MRTRQITLTIHPGLLKLVDTAAEGEFTTRSDIIRLALLWYLRPQGRDLAETNPDEIMKILQRRKALAELNKIMREDDIDAYDA